MTNGVVTLPLAGHWTVDESDLGAAASGRVREFVLGPENLLVAATVQRLLDVGEPDLKERAEQDRQPDPSEPSAQDRSFSAGDDSGRFGRLSPIVFCGVPGAGKSHLVGGLAEAWQRLRPNDNVTLLKGSQFAQQFAEAVEKNEVSRWHAPLRSADLFVLEDLVQLAGKPGAQIELLCTLDELNDRGALAVVTSRLAPHDLTNFLPELQSRLTAGLCIPLVLPEVEARRQILGNLCDARKVTLSENSLRQLARSLPLSAPELAGVLVNLQHVAQTAGQSLDDHLVQTYLVQRNASRQPQLRTIALHTARHFSLSMTDLRSPSRRRGVVVARDVAMYLARHLTSKSLKQIGRYFGGRDHTTVLHGCRKTESLMLTDPVTHDAVLSLRHRLLSK
ncbi:MAG TPA: helix-turn-helix domain-containing protein [Pirellulales bacterium]|nr:helix-turn-helix domain-containing protein [Pirellulales bacterium]